MEHAERLEPHGGPNARLAPAAPVLVSQRTSLAVAGVPPTKYLSLVAGHPQLIKIGQLRLLPLDALLQLLRLTGGREAVDPATQGVDGILAAIGRQVRQ